MFCEPIFLNVLPSMLPTVAHRFAQVLKRQTSLNHLCQASRTVLESGDVTSQMLEDWHQVDLGSIVRQTLYTMGEYKERDFHIIVTCECNYST